MTRPSERTRWRGCRILVVSPTPTHPQDYGNRKYLFETLRALKAAGAEIHFVHYASEQEWRHRRRRPWEEEMERAWTSYQLVAPTRDLHTYAIAEDHMIDEWADPALSQYVKWITSIEKFDAVIVNYTWMSFCLDAVQGGAFKILDTNDVFSGRRALLASNELKAEYFHTTPEEEAKALARADLVWAIKASEQTQLEDLGAKRCLTMLHAEPQRDWWKEPPSQDGWLRAGTIGARNNINRRNLELFLKDALPIFERHVAPVRIVIAGGCCKDFESFSHPNVEVIGRVEDVAEFYRGVDVVITPMQFSTGLKIKVSEALASGAPLIAHEHASEGYPLTEPLHLLPSFEAMAMELVKLSFDRAPLPKLAVASREASERIRVQVSQALSETREAIAASAAEEVLIVAPFVALDPRSLLFDHLVTVTDYLRFSSRLVIHFSGPPVNCDVHALHYRGIDARYFVDPLTAVALGDERPESWTTLSLVDLIQSRGAGRAYFLNDVSELRGLGASKLKRSFVRYDAVALSGGNPEELVDTLRSVSDVAVLSTSLDRIAPLTDRKGVSAACASPFRRSGRFESLATAIADMPKRLRLLVLAFAGDPLVDPVIELAKEFDTDTIVLDPTGPEFSDQLALTPLAPVEKNIDVPSLRLLLDLTCGDPKAEVLAEGAIRANVPVLKASRGAAAVDRYNAYEHESPSTFGSLLKSVARLLGDNLYRREVIARLPDQVASASAHDAGWNWLWHDLQDRRVTPAASATSSLLSVRDVGTAYKQLEAVAQDRTLNTPARPLFEYGSARVASPYASAGWQHVELHLNNVRVRDRVLNHLRIKLFARLDQVGIELRPETIGDPDGEILAWPDGTPVDQHGKYLRLEISSATTTDNNWSAIRDDFGEDNLGSLIILFEELSNTFARAASTFTWDSPETQKTWLRHCRTIRDAIAVAEEEASAA